MWLNDEQITDSAISSYRKSLLSSYPNHVVIDNLFNSAKLSEIISILQQPDNWKTQKHTYSSLYVNDNQWQKTCDEHRFVQRDAWQRDPVSSGVAQDFLSFLRSEEFLSVLSRIFNVQLTDINVEDPQINTNYFRLCTHDFIEQHADDSPGREVCMLVYLNKGWSDNTGGELVFIGDGDGPITIAPLFNRCVLFDPSSKGSEHWVERLNTEYTDTYRYNVTSWYWSE